MCSSIYICAKRNIYVRNVHIYVQIITYMCDNICDSDSIYVHKICDKTNINVQIETYMRDDIRESHSIYVRKYMC